MPRKLPQVPIQALFVFVVLTLRAVIVVSLNLVALPCLNSEKLRHIELSLMMVLIIQGELKLLSLV